MPDERGFWMLWTPHGPHPPAVRHTSYEEAERVAESMAKQHNIRFYILKTAGFVEPAPPVIRRRFVEDPNDANTDDIPF